MTDVQLGGATAFTALRTALWPKKGSAAFWFNLRRSGQGDYKTRHAGELRRFYEGFKGNEFLTFNNLFTF
jgi:hypothetical protein